MNLWIALVDGSCAVQGSLRRNDSIYNAITVDAQPGKSGQFDVVSGGTLVYSRADTGRFPLETDLEKIKF